MCKWPWGKRDAGGSFHLPSQKLQLHYVAEQGDDAPGEKGKSSFRGNFAAEGLPWQSTGAGC